MLYSGDKESYSSRIVHTAEEEAQFREIGLMDYADLPEPEPKVEEVVPSESPQGFVTTEQFDAVAERLAAAESEIERLKQGGTKAVDFLCVDRAADTTWLIEVKDYRHPDANRITVSELGTAVAEKVRDTLAGLAAAKNNANDANERQLARQALRTATFRVVLHVEIPARFKPYLDEASLVTKLKQQIKAIDAHPKVVSQNTTLRANLGWTVTG